MKKYIYLFLFLLAICTPAIAGTIHSYTEKNPGESADEIVIYDSDDGSTKKVKLGNLPATASSGGFTDGGTNVYTTTTTDNVAIGTTTPTQKLTVVGTISATAFTGDGSGITGITSSGWTDGGTNVYTTTTTDNVAIGTTTPNSASLEIVKQGSTVPFKISSSSSGNGDYLTITSSGGVGIGTTNPTSMNANWLVLLNSSSNGNRAIAINNPNTGTSAQTRLELKSSDSNGYVGNLPTNFTNAQAAGRTLLYNESGNGVGLAADTGNITFLTDFLTRRMTIQNSSGNVGIGTSSPVSKLEVNGLIIPDKVTADPCTAGQEGAVFYNDTSNYWCGCNGTDDVKLTDNTTACF